MLMPSLFRTNGLDRVLGTSLGGGREMMSTDVRETENGYEVIMNLPGFTKEDVKGEIKDGYLTVTATTNTSKDEKDAEGKYIRRERYSGSCSRSFYVGEEVTQDDIKAKFEDGTLKLTIPKKESQVKEEQKRYIEIEG
ncbi:MAG: Hsp20/alpha crystallin family protein [Lachnospiraceae bacterium]|nr:Hsp20/alpha crystallin family protein [Lachnospiraceae bacterium]MDE7240078.1 Hsp20/alpha crystallin family protein [Lachnospiraceae bacterium]